MKHQQGEQEALAHELFTAAQLAAMRCYVASQLGDKVEVPEELM
jgi:hypothetical protein